MNGKKTAALLTAAVLTAGAFAGCGSLNGAEVVATLNGKPIEVGLVNIVAQQTAASYDTYMASYYGAGMWDEEMGSTEGETLSDEVRHEAMDTVELQYLMEEHMGEYSVTVTDEDQKKIDAAAAEFLSENTPEALKIMGADEKYVKEMLRLQLIESKVEEAIRDTADTEVTDEELAERNAAAQEEASEEEETAAEEEETAEEEDAEEVDSEEEEEAEEPEVTADDIIAERQDAVYTEVTDGWKESADFTVNEGVLKKIDFSKFLRIVGDPEEETEEPAESVDDTETGDTEESVPETEETVQETETEE